MEQWLMRIGAISDTYLFVFQGALRYLIPGLVFVILLRVCMPLLTFRREPEIWGWLCLSEEKRLPITHWENVIGRSRRSDIVINVRSVSRNHAVLTRYDDGSWTISDAGSKTGIRVNGKEKLIGALEPGDVIEIGGIDLTFVPITRKQEKKLAQLRTKAASPLDSLTNVMLLTFIQILICLSYLMNCDSKYAVSIFYGFAGIALMQWLLLTFYLIIRKPSFEVETIAFLLCTMGMAALAAAKPGETVKQLAAMGLGIAAFLLVGWSVRDLERAKKMRYMAGVAGIALLIITLLFGKEYHGAKNWLIIGSMSIQPSELTKVCFVFMGASAMENIMNRKNIILFIVYTLAICGCLAVMNDFGTALIFFVAFLLIAYLRSGSVGTVALACTALGFAGVLAVKIAPHALRRFATWRHIWEDPLGAGYQQTRALMCIASGGLFGLGAGNGWMRHVFAADSDMVFATISEELGLVVSCLLVAGMIVLAIFAMRTAVLGRSSFYVIGACTAAGILLVQTIFNVLGTVDVLPLTGVTFPFVSNGGSSMICAWGLLAFVKASDTRQNASFAVRQSKEGVVEDE